MAELFSLNCFNTRWLGESVKRRAIFRWLKNNHNGTNSFTFLQETHSSPDCEYIWKQEWGAHIEFCHGTSNSKGVALLFPSNSTYKIDNVKHDANGRILFVELHYENTHVVLINIYAPTKDHPTDQLLFLNFLTNVLNEYVDANIIIGGDFNICLNPEIDKKRWN